MKMRLQTTVMNRLFMEFQGLKDRIFGGSSFVIADNTPEVKRYNELIKLFVWGDVTILNKEITRSMVYGESFLQKEVA